MNLLFVSWDGKNPLEKESTHTPKTKANGMERLWVLCKTLISVRFMTKSSHSLCDCPGRTNTLMGLFMCAIREKKELLSSRSKKSTMLLCLAIRWHADLWMNCITVRTRRKARLSLHFNLVHW